MSQAAHYDKELQDLLNEADEQLDQDFHQVDLDLILNDNEILAEQAEITSEELSQKIGSLVDIIPISGIKMVKQEPSGELDEFMSDMGEEDLDKLWNDVENNQIEKQDSIHEEVVKQGQTDFLSTLELQQLPDLQSYGTPVALAVGSNHLIVGLENSQVLVIEVGTWKVLRELTIHSILDEQRVTSLDIRSDIVVSGYSNGMLAVWNAVSGSRLKSIGGVHVSPIVSLKILDCVRPDKSQVNFVSGDHSGNIFWMTVKHVLLWGYCFDRQRLLPKLNQPCLEIQTLSGRNKIERQYTLVTVSSYDTVYTLCLYPTTRLLHQFTRPIFIPPHKKIQPHIDWGFARTQTKLSPVLVIAWDHLITVVSFNILQQDARITPKQENHLFHYLQHAQITHCKFISDSCLVIYDQNSSFQILSIPDFQTGQYPMLKKFDLEQLNSTHYTSCQGCVQQTLSFTKEIDAQQFQDSQELITNNTIRTTQNHVYVLHQGIVENIILLNWTQYLNKMVDYVDHSSDHNLNQLMNTMTQVFKGQLRGMTQLISKEEQVLISQLSRRLIRIFIEGQAQAAQTASSTEGIKTQWNEVAMTLTVQYCLDGNLMSYLFEELKPLIAEHVDMEQFFCALEPFIASKLITVVDQKTFVQIANHLLVHEKHEILQEFLISLELNSIDIGFTYQLCIEQKMFLPLVYICPRINNDFLTPLNKMLYKWQEGADGSLLEKCLWFMDVTWLGGLYPSERLSYASWVLALHQQIIWLLSHDNFIVFFQHTCTNLFKLLTLLFHEPSLTLLRENHPDLIEYFQARDVTKQIIVSIQTSFHLIQEKTDEHVDTFYSFIGRVASLKCEALNIEITIAALTYFTHHPHTQIKWNLLHAGQPYISQIINNADLKNEIDVRAYSLFIGGDATACLKMLCDACVDNNLLIFQFIQFALSNHPEMSNVLILSIQGIFERLIQLSPSESYQISKTIGLNYQEESQDLSALQCDPIKLLEYLECAMSERPDWKVKMKTSLKYIELLSAHQPMKVYDELKRHLYPLHEVEKILSVGQQHREGLAYIKEQFGQYEGALSLYFEVLSEELESRIRLAHKGDTPNMSQLEHHFTQVMACCRKAQEASEDNKVIESYCSREVLYISLANKLFNGGMLRTHWQYLGMTTHLNAGAMRHLTTTLNVMFSGVFIAISKEISITPLIELMERNAELFNICAFRSAFTQVLEDICWEYLLLQKTKTIVIQDNIDMNEVMVVDSSASPGYKNLCLECQQPDSDVLKQAATERNDNVLLLRCGHTVHQVCVRNKYCSICQNRTVEASIHSTPFIIIVLQSLFEEERKQLSKLKDYTYTYLQPPQHAKSFEQLNQSMDLMESLDQLDQAQIREQRMANKMQAFDSIMEDHQTKLEEFTKKYDIPFDI